MNAPPSALNLFGNPIFRRYWRSRLRRVRAWITVIITLVTSLFIVAMAYLPLRYRGDFSEVDAARTAFLPLLFVQIIIMMLFGTAAVGGGILREVDEGMIEYQRLTPLSPLSKVFGYLFGLPARQYVAFAVTAVFTGFVIVVGKIPLVAWGSVYLVFFTSAILYHLLALVTGLIIKSRWRAGLISIGLVLLLNLVLPRLAEFGFALFSHMTIWPVVINYLPDLIPTLRDPFRIRPDWFATSEVPFFGLKLSHLSFSLIVQGSLILTFIVMLVRRWRDDQAHLLGKGYAVCFLIWLQSILLGNILPLLDRGRILTGMLGNRTDITREFRRVSGSVEALVLSIMYGVLCLLILVPIIACITPKEPTQMVAFRRRKKFGQRRIPLFSDGASSAPFVWIAAGVSGTAWTILVERLSTSPAFKGSGFPMEAWAVFIGVTLVVGALFHFIMEGYGRRAAWFALFLVGFIPVFTSLVLISISNRLADTAKYVVAITPLGAAWQPMQWLNELGKEKAAMLGAPVRADFGPFILFCGVQLTLCLILLVLWRRRRKYRESRA